MEYSTPIFKTIRIFQASRFISVTLFAFGCFRSLFSVTLFKFSSGVRLNPTPLFGCQPDADYFGESLSVLYVFAVLVFLHSSYPRLCRLISGFYAGDG